MKQILQAIEQREREVAKHPFYTWISAETSPEQAFCFAPLFVNFIMAFSDINKWLMRYPKPRDHFECVINTHTAEDQTHSRLFLEDWHKLDLDAALGWRASDMIWWYYAGEATERFRAFGMELMSMVARNSDPLVRFAVMEAIEACGHVFFSHTAPVASALAQRSGVEYRYFGPYHLALETGHIHGDEGIFAQAQLSPEQRARALPLIERVFDMFLVENDLLLAYARGDASSRARSGRPAARRGAPRVPAAAASAPVRPLASEPLPAPCERLQRALSHELQVTARHPLFEWMRTDPLPPLEKLRRLVPLWLPDIMGYRDLTRYALPCPGSADPRERAINRWLERLSSHASLFIGDWQHLGMDEQLGWSAGQTLAFCSFGPQTELARRNYLHFVQLGFTIDHPVVRYWFITALEATGLPFFAHTRELAHAAEQPGRPLDYLGDRHALAHREQEPDPGADAVDFTREPLDPDDERAASEILSSVFAAIRAQYSETLQRVTSAKTAEEELS